MQGKTPGNKSRRCCCDGALFSPAVYSWNQSVCCVSSSDRDHVSKAFHGSCCKVSSRANELHTDSSVQQMVRYSVTRWGHVCPAIHSLLSTSTYFRHQVRVIYPQAHPCHAIPIQRAGPETADAARRSWYDATQWSSFRSSRAYVRKAEHGYGSNVLGIFAKMFSSPVQPIRALSLKPSAAQYSISASTKAPGQATIKSSNYQPPYERLLIKLRRCKHLTKYERAALKRVACVYPTVS